jgi:hypothetical protein
MISAAAVVLSLAAAVATPSHAAVTVTGDKTAWHEIEAAFQKLDGTTYRMTMTAPGQTVIVEHVPPDSRRTITTITGQVGEIESIGVGGETRVRVIGPGASANWTCNDEEAPQPPIVLTMEGLGMAVEVARRPDVLIVGAHARAYLLTYTFQGKRPGHRTTVYVDRKTGLPKRSITPYGTGTVVATYYDYGAPITITLPPCQ